MGRVEFYYYVLPSWQHSRFLPLFSLIQAQSGKQWNGNTNNQMRQSVFSSHKIAPTSSLLCSSSSWRGACSRSSTRTTSSKCPAPTSGSGSTSSPSSLSSWSKPWRSTDGRRVSGRLVKCLSDRLQKFAVLALNCQQIVALVSKYPESVTMLSWFHHNHTILQSLVQ